MTDTPNAPKVKQCTDPEHWQFGCVAVQGDGGRWGIMNPVHGGHWGTDDEVQDWADVTPSKRKA